MDVMGQHTYQPLVPCKDDSIKHGLVEETVAHPLRYDDVNLFNRKLHLLHFAPKNCDNLNTKKYLFVLLNLKFCM